MQENMTQNVVDTVEREYLIAIKRAEDKGDNEEAFWLSVGLEEYRSTYKMPKPLRVDTAGIPEEIW